jgi:hypothetical protein
MKSLSDVVGSAGLQGYAEVALLIFFVVFVLVALRALTMRSRDLDHVARLPLDDDRPASSSDPQGAQS